MSNKSNAILQDSGMERAVLAGIIARGSDCFFEVEDILCVKDFYWSYNQEIFTILAHLVHEQDVKTFDLPNIQAVAKILGFDNFVGGGKHSEYLASLTEEIGSSEDNIKKLVVVIYKFSLARRGYMAAQKVQHNLKSITGAEDVDEIISNIEEPIFKFTGDIMDQGASVVSLGQRFEEAMKTLSKTPQDIIGLPTGFPMWDEAIGGGLRPATVNVVGARAKVGKCVNSFGTAILTNKGVLMPYELFDAKRKKKCSNIDFQLLNEHGHEKLPAYWWNNGLTNTIEIQTKYGGTLSVTPNHPLRILANDGKIKWKNAEDLQLGDYLVSRRGDNYWGDQNLNLDDAYTIGLLVGDGCINNKIVDLSSHDNVCRDHFEAFILRHNGTIGTRNKTGLRCNIVNIAKKISQLGFYNEKRYKILPKCIRMANCQVVCQALSGYFDADGCVEKGGVTATTNSQELAIQLRAILLNLGILSGGRMRFIVPPGHDKARPYWEIAIRNVESVRLFRDFIGFKLKRKQKLLNKFCTKQSSTKNDIVPHLSNPLIKLKDMVRKNRGYFLPGRYNKMRDAVNSWIRKNRRARRDIVEKLLNQLVDYADSKEYNVLESLIDPTLIFDPVRQLSTGKAWTSDFYIPDGHSFITNGFISHNSFFCMNVGRNVAENGIPVLYLDTELTSDMQLHRLTSLITKIDLNHVETGQFVNNHHESDAIWGCKEHVENLTIDHFSVAGLSPQAIMSIARRWLSKTVGFTDSGAAKPCLIVYDYIKLMNDGSFKNNLQEYQLLGFLITALHNFAVKFKLPVLATVQLNRDGVDKEGSEVVSGSDRIIWLCSNFTILKPKSQTELNEDPVANGTKKLIVTATRCGPGMESGEYINIIDELSVGKLSEGKPFSAVAHQSLGNQAIE